MLVLENIKFAFSSLWSNKIRSGLTMLGVIIGVFSVITLISIGEGVRDEFSNQIGALGSNLIVIVSGKIDGGVGKINPAGMIGVSTLTKDDAMAIQALPEVSASTSLMLYSGVVQYDNISYAQGLLAGTTENYLDLLNMQLAQGRFINTQDMEDKARVVVLGYGAKQAIFGDEDALGKTVRFLNTDFTVVGNLADKTNAVSMGGTDFNNLILIPLSTGTDITGSAQLFRIVAKTADPGQVQATADKVKTTMLAQHQGSDDFSVLTQKDLLGLFDSIFSILTSAISGIGAISLIVGGIGIMNIMLVSVTERTREIGIRKALGATNINILAQFLMEAASLSVLGGAFGVGLTYGVGRIIEKYAEIPVVITPAALILAVSISLAVGIIFGLAPAVKASRKSPIEAVRYE